MYDDNYMGEDANPTFRAKSKSCCKVFILFLIVPDDKTLPSVPPLQLSIPSDYPEQSPQWDNDDQQYGKTAVFSV